MIFISTLLPEPFSPTSPTSSPGPISRLAPRNTATVERRPGKPVAKALRHLAHAQNRFPVRSGVFGDLDRFAHTLWGYTSYRPSDR